MITALTTVAPDAVALSAACGTLTYGALDRSATALAVRLQAAGVAAGSLVGICAERSFVQIVAMLAGWKLGAAYLPLDPAWPAERLRGLVAEADCAALVCGEGCGDMFADSAVPMLRVDGDDLLAEPAAGVAFPDPSPDALAYVIYTSGSTGTPKGVEISHANLTHLIDWHVDAFAVTPADRAAHLAGLGFDAAVWEVWPYLRVGASVALVPEAARTSAALLQAWLVEQNITIAFAPTALAEQLVAMDWPAGTRLRFLLTGADVLHVRPRLDLPFALVNNYGPTECTVVATSAIVPADAATDGIPPIGRPIAGTQIHLLNEQGAPVAPGEIGEIFIGGGSVARGYRGRPDLTAERFLADPFSDAPGARLYRTGDLGRLLPDGQIAFHGRSDDQVKIRGHRIEPDEIASVIGRHEGVAACAVAARKSGAGDSQLVAYLLFAPGRSATADEMRDFIAERLPDYMVPASFVRLDALPLTANGKLDRKALPAPSNANALDDHGFAAPETPVEELLIGILTEVLGRGRIGIDDNFFLLGGHSLLGTQVVLRAGEAFGVELTLRHLFQAPTVRRLGALIEQLILAMVEAMSDDDVRLHAAE